MSSSSKPHLNLVVCGHVDHGKSTTVGHLLFLTGYIDERKMSELAAASAKTGLGETFKFAWVLDKLKEERERGMTIDTMYVEFETPKYYFTIIDAPGHRDFVKNMITGASQADAALLIASAKKGEFETGISPEGQTTEHAFLLFTLGVSQIVVGVNKMDDPSVNWSKERFEEVKKAIEELLTKIGFNLKKSPIPIVPISGWTGDNLVKKSEKMPWYDGPTLIEALDSVKPPAKPIDKPLRIPIQDVYSITGVGTVPVGRVESGVLKPGDKIILMPSGKTGEVKSIEMHHKRLEKAEPGDNIGFNVKGIAKNEIRRGDVISHPETPPTVAKEFIGQIIVIYHPTAIAAGYTPVLHVHTAQVACQFVELLKKFDPRTGAVLEENPQYLKTGDGALVKFRPVRPVCIERYADFPALGRFAIRDMGRTIAAGVVKEVTEKA
ncbi:translation elongation factor EF-1 subunit alpha [Candidatus Bathyarchaeota archaeon ex4484_205]|nr:MAG: translation elongation factor EF-1 subunit alpha [Candidatus Bathyarchaeota archaeon ex4484_205]